MASEPERPRRVGRKREIRTEGWAHVPFKLPKEMMMAYENFLFEEGRRMGSSLKKVPFIRDWLEKKLEEAGYLRVIVTEDPETGSMVKEYQAVAGERMPRAKGRKPT